MFSRAHRVRSSAKAAAALTVAGAFAAVIASTAGAAESARTLATTPALTSSTSTSSSSESTSSGESSTDPNAVYADIRMELNAPSGDEASGPLVFSATNRLVGDGPELTHSDRTSNPSEYGGDVIVDITLDPLTVFVSGGEGWDSFGDAFLTITLHGKTFGSVTLTSDGLFGAAEEPEGPIGPPDGPPEGTPQAFGLSGFGAHGFARGVATALLPMPTLQSYGVSGSTFTAHWQGTSWAPMSGSAQFGLTFAAGAPTASAANPVFTG